MDDTPDIWKSSGGRHTVRARPHDKISQGEQPVPHRIAAIGQVVGAGLTAWGVFGDGLSPSTADLRALGVTAVVVSALWYVITRPRGHESAIFEAGRQAGWEAGFIDGRKCGRPEVIRLHVVRDEDAG